MISSHTGFQPLEEVWLGDVYPADWYEGFDSEYLELLYKITEYTKEDLNRFSKVLESLGVTVRRPDINDPEKFRDWQGNLCKPPITPRDWAMALDDTLYIIPQYENSFTGFESTIEFYQKNGHKVKVLDRSISESMCYLPFPSTVRVGKDLYVDSAKDSIGYNFFLEICEELSKKYRVHITHNNEHNDGIFCPIKPGHIVSTHYGQCYDQTFPDWKVFWLHDTTIKRKDNGFSASWWVDGVDLQIYNNSVLRYAKDWIGNSAETIFEVNMLIIDEKNICCIIEDDLVCGYLESLGFNVHVIDFRCRGFWDGGLHCLTTDIRRVGAQEDYWPDRGPPGIYYHSS
jgi:hypothetical protein